MIMGPYGLEQNYSRVFKDMPALFERIMEMLQEKPQVLETNDVITFYDKVFNQVSPVSPDEMKLDKREVNLDDSIDNFGGTEAKQQYNMLFKDNDDFEAFIGSAGSDVSKLISADEMVDMMLIVEQKLEEYNHDND
ncbi:hypothetical protein MSG28_005938 [Choristoneura fumiferana]|uniref:Uncharacterized protein n=1 Tax=Choristoneura fumiferana TaxID=7141 RepID=A0ACC0L217_CHOFU|nr:hypothetical protein MSG28_005938 [Choristoneura fumiferana]